MPNYINVSNCEVRLSLSLVLMCNPAVSNSSLFRLIFWLIMVQGDNWV